MRLGPTFLLPRLRFQLLHRPPRLRITNPIGFQDWEKQPVSFREIHEIELQIAETQRDLQYFREVVTDLERQLRSLQTTSVTGVLLR